MRSKNWFVLALVLGTLSFAPACGGGGDDENVDAAGDGDGDGDGDIDAAPAEFMGIGQLCDNTNMCPAAGATDCTALSEGATHGFCTQECAVTATNAQPVAADHQACQTAYMGEIPAQGTPACTIYVDEGAPAMRHWSCAIQCGVYMTTDFGGCPPDLTCTDNFCQ